MKAHYALAEANVASFERECSELCSHLDEASSFMEEVNQYVSPTALFGHITELERLLEDKK